MGEASSYVFSFDSYIIPYLFREGWRVWVCGCVWGGANTPNDCMRIKHPNLTYVELVMYAHVKLCLNVI